MKLELEIELDENLKNRFEYICEELNLDTEAEMCHCVEEYIAALREEVEEI